MQVCLLLCCTESGYACASAHITNASACDIQDVADDSGEPDIKLFLKWELAEINVSDISLTVRVRRAQFVFVFVARGRSVGGTDQCRKRRGSVVFASEITRMQRAR